MSYDKFEDMVWEEFLQTGLDESEWPNFIEDAVADHNAMIEDSWRDYAY
jgi:hypothetical protein